MKTPHVGEIIKDSALETPPEILHDTVAVIGLGYVGLPLALLARKKGFNVYGVDIDTKKRADIASGKVHDLDEESSALLQEERLSVSGKFSDLEQASTIVICVPTPVDAEHNPDLSLVENACLSVARHLKPGQLIILESTVHPGTSEELLIPLIEQESGLRAGIDFDFAHCPERINPGDTQWTANKIPRVVGGITPHSRTAAANFYRSILDAPLHEMHSIKEAEAVKMVENSFRDINIAFVNELAMSFDKLGIDVTHVLEGASTKPFGFMLHKPGCGVGGHCIPVDPYYLIRYAKNNGFTHEFLSLARDINNRMPDFTVDLLLQELTKLNILPKDAVVALLGLSYKANVSDLRESPSFEILEHLEKRGIGVKVFDPFTPERSTVHSLNAALVGADAVIVATAHEAFKKIPAEFFAAHGIRIFIDGRNAFPKEQFLDRGIAYRGIGR